MKRVATKMDRVRYSRRADGLNPDEPELDVDQMSRRESLSKRDSFQARVSTNMARVRNSKFQAEPNAGSSHGHISVSQLWGKARKRTRQVALASRWLKLIQAEDKRRSTSVATRYMHSSACAHPSLESQSQHHTPPPDDEAASNRTTAQHRWRVAAATVVVTRPLPTRSSEQRIVAFSARGQPSRPPTALGVWPSAVGHPLCPPRAALRVWPDLVA